MEGTRDRIERDVALIDFHLRCRKCRARGLAILAAALFYGAPIDGSPFEALAGAKVSGSPDAVEVEADDASVEEVLSALRDAFALRYRTAGDMRFAISGSYTGSLREVVSRILNRYDFVMESSPSGTIVAVYGPGGDATKSAALANDVAPPPAAGTSHPHIESSGTRKGPERRAGMRGRRGEYIRVNRPPLQ